MNTPLARPSLAQRIADGCSLSPGGRGAAFPTRLGIAVVIAATVTGCHSGLLREPELHQGVTQTPQPSAVAQSVARPVAPIRANSPEPATDGLARVGQPLVSPPIVHSRINDPLVSAISFTQNDPRRTVSEDGRVLKEPEASWMTGTAWQRHPDEYLLSGGDRSQPVHYDSFFRYGVETEDTFAEYVDHLGKSHTLDTGAVAIYAPRFASVRTTASPSGGVSVEKLSGVKDSRFGSGIKLNIAPDTYVMADQAHGSRVRSRASGLEKRDWLAGTDGAIRLQSRTRLMNTFMDFAYAYRAEFNQRDEARLAAGIAAAQHWTRDENPVVVAQLNSANEVHAKFRLTEIVGTEPQDTEPGRLKIVKLADIKVVQPGEVVTFAIRYDNLGERELYNVRVVDNLTPRLELIEESASSDRSGDLFMQDNEEGSLVLTFQLDDPLPAKTGGLITFQCRVR